MSWLHAAMVIATLLALHARAFAESVRFDPPSPVETAQARYERGKKFFEAKQYAVAADEFAAAYQLDPGSKFLLFNLGVARRMAGACKEAIEAYRAFLDAGPPAQLASNAQVGIERCEKIVATLPEPGTPEPPSSPPPSSPPPSSSPVPDPVAIDTPVAEVLEPWYRDRAGNTLVIAGGVTLGTSAVLYVLARGRANATTAPASLQAYEDNRIAASRLQIASAITGVAGAVLVVAGVIHYAAYRSTPRRVAAVPLEGGGMVVIGGRF